MLCAYTSYGKVLSRCIMYRNSTLQNKKQHKTLQRVFCTTVLRHKTRRTTKHIINIRQPAPLPPWSLLTLSHETHQVNRPPSHPSYPVPVIRTKHQKGQSSVACSHQVNQAASLPRNPVPVLRTNNRSSQPGAGPSNKESKGAE
jgi:hypothetical protein